MIWYVHPGKFIDEIWKLFNSIFFKYIDIVVDVIFFFSWFLFHFFFVFIDCIFCCIFLLFRYTTWYHQNGTMLWWRFVVYHELKSFRISIVSPLYNNIIIWIIISGPSHYSSRHTQCFKRWTRQHQSKGKRKRKGRK